MVSFNENRPSVLKIIQKYATNWETYSYSPSSRQLLPQRMNSEMFTYNARSSMFLKQGGLGASAT